MKLYMQVLIALGLGLKRNWHIFAGLILGVFAMTVELAVRFLSDYISGDKYFKTKYPGHNLERARNQIALAEDIKRKNCQQSRWN